MKSITSPAVAGISRCIVVLLGIFAVMQPVQAQYPDKTVRIIVPFAPGAQTDAIARVVANGLSKQLGKTFLVENRPGAGGLIGTDAVIKSDPDGYTLLFTGGAALFPLFVKEATFDPRTAFSPISTVYELPFALIVTASIPANTLAEFISVVKASPKKYNHASASLSYDFLYLEMLRADNQLDTVHILYKGGAPMYQALLTGEVHYGLGAASAAAPMVKDGKVRVLAVTGEERHALFPQAPTFGELRARDIRSPKVGLLAPANVPRDIVARLNQAVVTTMQSPEVREPIMKIGNVVSTSTAEEFSRAIADEYVRFSAITKAAGIKPQ